MMPTNTITIPKTEHRITGDYRADQLIEYVRANNYPKWNTQPIFFANDTNYALCSELDEKDMNCLLTAVHEGIYDEGSKYNTANEKLTRFDGGWVLTNNYYEWNVYVDGHMYFFDF